MSKLIQSLVESYHYGISSEVPVGVNPMLQAKAVRLYQQAAEQMWIQRKGFTQAYQTTLGKIDRNIAIQVTAELDTLDLLDTRQYQAIKAAIEHWRPEADSEHSSKCLKVYQALLTMLPAARQKQRLQQPLLEYHSHLKADIESQLAENHPAIYENYCHEQKVTVLRKGEVQQQVIRAKDMDHFVGQNATFLVKNDGVHKAMEKYASVSIAQDTLYSSKPATEQLEDFRQVFPSVKSLIEKSRDSAGMTFLKAVATVFSLGIAAFMGIWDVKGQKTAEKVQSVLATPVVLGNSR